MQLAAAQPSAGCQRRHEWIRIRNARTFLVQNRHDIESRRFADIVDISFVSNADNEHTGSVDCLSRTVQSFGDLVNDEVRHRSVHLPGKLDKSRFETTLLGLPR